MKKIILKSVLLGLCISIMIFITKFISIICNSMVNITFKYVYGSNPADTNQFQSPAGNEEERCSLDSNSLLSYGLILH